MIRLTRAQVREIDRRSIEDYRIPGIVLMENAGHRVVEFLEKRFAPLEMTMPCYDGTLARG